MFWRFVMSEERDKSIKFFLEGKEPSEQDTLGCQIGFSWTWTLRGACEGTSGQGLLTIPAQCQAEIWVCGRDESPGRSQTEREWVQDPRAWEMSVGMESPCPRLSMATATWDNEGLVCSHWADFIFTQLFRCFLAKQRQDHDKYRIVLKVCCFANDTCFKLLPPKKLLQHLRFSMYGIRRKLVDYQ